MDTGSSRRCRRHNLWIIIVILFTGFITAVLAVTEAAAENIDIKDKVYLGVYGWSKGEPFKNPSGVFFNSRRSELYVADSGNHQILIFSALGAPVAKIRHYVDGKEPGDSKPGEPKQVVVNSRGDILCVDSLARYLDVMDYRGRSVERIYPGDLLKMERNSVSCTAVAIDSADNIYIGTGGEEATVLVLDSSLRFVRRIGKKGDGQEMFRSITGIWVDQTGKIYVTDALGEPCVQVFSSQGKFLFGIGAHSVGPNNFSLPSGVVTDDLGNIYVLDNLRHLFVVFTPEGKLIARLSGGYGGRPGDLAYPTGISGDGKRAIFTVEKVGARLQGFKIEITPPKAG